MKDYKSAYDLFVDMRDMKVALCVHTIEELDAYIDAISPFIDVKSASNVRRVFLGRGGSIILDIMTWGGGHPYLDYGGLSWYDRFGYEVIDYQYVKGLFEYYNDEITPSEDSVDLLI